MSSPKKNLATYFPPPESQGGWRYLKEPDDVRDIGGMDPDVLDDMAFQQANLWGNESWSVAIIRHGHLVREYHAFNILKATRFDIFSGTKSFTGTAWGLLLEDSRQGKLPEGKTVELDSPVYPFIPEGYPLTDERKELMTIRHLLTMTSGLPGGSKGVYGMPTDTWNGPFEHALGRCSNRFGKWGDRLLGEPGTVWDYSDLGWCHLSMAFANIAGQDMRDYMQARIFEPIGIENLSWDIQGGAGFIGPYTNAHMGIHVSARELARFGFLLLNNGVWDGKRLIPEWWMDLSTKPSQDLNPAYGYSWWVGNPNTGGQWVEVFDGAFALSGHRTNYCFIIPSLNMVIARVGSGPSMPEYSAFNKILTAILD